MLTQTKSSLVDPLYVYFINLDHSTDRREQFLKSVNLLPSHLKHTIRLQRVSAVTSEDVVHMIANKSLVLNGVDNLVDRNTSYEWWDKKYTSEELACTLSHLKATRQAYLDGHESVLIVEDDAVLTNRFLESWNVYADLAPVDWAILQWTTNNAVVNRKQSHRSNDFWISWTGYHWSTIAYTISRECMKKLLIHTSSKFSPKREQIEPIQWWFDQKNMLRADELLYFIAEKTYTSTYCWIVPSKFNSTIHRGHIPWFHFGQSKHSPSSSVDRLRYRKRQESIAVVMSIRISDAKQIGEELCNLDADIRSLAHFNPRSKWFVKVVLTHFDLVDLFRQSLSKLQDAHVQLQVELSNERFNKFTLVREKLDAISKFDYVLLKDNDIRLAGFEWNTFSDANKHSIISGPYRQKVEGTTSRYKKYIYYMRKDPTAHVNLQDATLFNTYRDDDFQTVLSKAVMTLEEFMVMMNSSFAAWFFNEILTSDFLSQDIDWGPDLMWCGAAYDYQQQINNPKRGYPCSLTSLNINDMDKRQISKAKDVESYLTYVERGNQVVESFMTKNLTFKRWIEASNRPIIQYQLLREWCSLHSKHKQISACLKDYHNEFFKKFTSSYMTQNETRDLVILADNSR